VPFKFVGHRHAPLTAHLPTLTNFACIGNSGGLPNLATGTGASHRAHGESADLPPQRTPDATIRAAGKTVVPIGPWDARNEPLVAGSKSQNGSN
jgi:hypothetical protein